MIDVNWNKLLGDDEFWGTVLPPMIEFMESQQKEVRDVVNGHAYCTECLEYIPGGAEALIKGDKVRHIRCQLDTDQGELLPTGHIDNAPSVPWWMEYTKESDLDEREWPKQKAS